INLKSCSGQARSVPYQSIAPQFPVVDLQAAQHPLEGRTETVILVVRGDEYRVDDVTVIKLAGVELRALAAPGHSRASDERQGDDRRSVDRAAPVRAADEIEMRVILQRAVEKVVRGFNQGPAASDVAEAALL